VARESTEKWVKLEAGNLAPGKGMAENKKRKKGQENHRGPQCRRESKKVGRNRRNRIGERKVKRSVNKRGKGESCATPPPLEIRFLGQKCLGIPM